MDLSAPSISDLIKLILSIPQSSITSNNVDNTEEELDSSSTGDAIETDEEKDLSIHYQTLTKNNIELNIKNDKLIEENEKLKQNVLDLNKAIAKLKRELSEEVAKSMAADEW